MIAGAPPAFPMTQSCAATPHGQSTIRYSMFIRNLLEVQSLGLVLALCVMAGQVFDLFRHADEGLNAFI